MILRWYQDAAIDAMWQYFAAGSLGNPLVALPTGTGKSPVQAGFIQKALSWYPRSKFLCLTHVKELIEQNAATMQRMWPSAPLGICSAGLRQFNTMMPITFGGCKTVVNRLDELGYIDILFIDEAHLLSPKDNSSYQVIITHLRKINPWLKVIGLTATPFRRGTGLLTDGGLFTQTVFDMCNMEGFRQLIAEGFLSPLIPKKTATTFDISGVGIQQGEYQLGAMQAAVDKPDTTHLAVREACELGSQRHSWLTFAAGIEHAEHVAEQFRYYGVPTAALHSKVSDGNRVDIIRDFKSGALRNVVTNNMLTTGFDHPPIDFIGMMRPTMSVPLWVQMLGRGTRPSPATNKNNCLCADFAGNTRRLGPIDDPFIARPPKDKLPGEMPVKLCERCGTYNHARAAVCAGCGFEFTFEVKIFKTAGTEQLMSSDLPQITFFKVDRVLYNRHEKKNKETGAIISISVKVSYVCGLRMFNEWINFNHPGFPGKKAREWWRQRHRDEPPATTDEALGRMRELRVPTRIRVWINKPMPEVLSYEYH